MERFFSRRTFIGWTAVAILVLFIILAPFFLLESHVNRITDDLIRNERNPLILAIALGGLLAIDILLPVPSSLVSTAAGSLFGFAGGTLVSWAGMTAGCLIGYSIGLKAGTPVVRKLAGQRELERIERAQVRYRVWMIVIFRAVPVLAEASVLFAGMTRARLRGFLLLTALSNLGISAAYAAAGALAADAGTFLLAFAAAVLLPAMAMGLVRLFRT